MIGRKSPFGNIEYKQAFLFRVKQHFKAGKLYKITTISPSGESKDSILEGRFLFYKGFEKKGGGKYYLIFGLLNTTLLMISCFSSFCGVEV